MKNHSYRLRLTDFVIVALMAITFVSCNKDDVIEDFTGKAPVITLDSEDGIYTVKVGQELSISPDVEYAEDAIYNRTQPTADCQL